MLSNDRFATLWVSAVVGVVGGLLALAFRLLVDCSWWLLSSVRGQRSAIEAVLTLSVPALGGLAAGWLMRKDRQPTSLTDDGVHSSYAQTGWIIGAPSAIRRLCACAATTGSFGSAGCEDAVGRATGSIATWLVSRFRLGDSRLQIFVACGAAAGLTGLFSTPIAAAVFAVEVVLGGHAIRGIVPLLISVATATAIVRLVSGGEGPFVLPDFALMGPADLGVFLVLGLVCGLVGAGFVWGIQRVDSIALRANRPMVACAGGLLVGVIVLFVPSASGVGYPALTQLFGGETGLSLLLALLVAKLFATAITLGSRGTGGMIGPSMVVGASLGCLVGKVADSGLPSTFASPYSFGAAGMVAMVAAVMRAPITAAVLLVECTRSYQAFVPGVVVAVAASALSSVLRKTEETEQLEHSPVVRESVNPHSSMPPNTTIHPLVRCVQDTVPISLSARQFLGMVLSSDTDIAVVVDGSRVVGTVSRRTILSIGHSDIVEKTVGDYVVETGVLESCESVSGALLKFRHLNMARSRSGLSGASAIPVVDDDSGLVGVLSRKDLMDHCARGLLREYPRTWRHVEGNEQAPQPMQQPMRQPMQQPLRHEVTAIAVSDEFVGKTLGKLDLLRRFGLVCVGIRRLADSGGFVPVRVAPSHVISSDDVLILTGTSRDIEVLTEETFG